jgi:hypothetical protein
MEEVMEHVDALVMPGALYVLSQTYPKRIHYAGHRRSLFQASKPNPIHNH